MEKQSIHEKMSIDSVFCAKTSIPVICSIHPKTPVFTGVFRFIGYEKSVPSAHPAPRGGGAEKTKAEEAHKKIIKREQGSLPALFFVVC